MRARRTFVVKKEAAVKRAKFLGRDLIKIKLVVRKPVKP